MDNLPIHEELIPLWHNYKCAESLSVAARMAGGMLSSAKVAEIMKTLEGIPQNGIRFTWVDPNVLLRREDIRLGGLGENQALREELTEADLASGEARPTTEALPHREDLTDVIFKIKPIKRKSCKK